MYYLTDVKVVWSTADERTKLNIAVKHCKSRTFKELVKWFPSREECVEYLQHMLGLPSTVFVVEQIHLTIGEQIPVDINLQDFEVLEVR